MAVGRQLWVKNVFFGLLQKEILEVEKVMVKGSVNADNQEPSTVN